VFVDRQGEKGCKGKSQVVDFKIEEASAGGNKGNVNQPDLRGTEQGDQVFWLANINKGGGF